MLSKIFKRDLECSMPEGHLDKLRSLTKDFADHSEIVTSVYSASLLGEEVAYLSDMENYQLIWANQTVLKEFSKNAVGRKCYEVLQNREEPCPFCTNDKIRKHGSWIWLFHNDVVGKDYFIKDMAVMWNSKPVRFEVAFDITGLGIEKHGTKLP